MVIRQNESNEAVGGLCWR